MSPDLEHAFGNINMHGEESHVLVEPEEEELAELKCKMFGKIFNSSFLQLKLLEDELNKIHSSDEDIKLKPIGSGVFMFKISGEVLRNFIVEHSPWLICGACMSFKAWNEGLIPHKISFSMLEFWFQIYNLPLEFNNSKNALVLGKKLGSPVKTDNETFFNESGAFMRVKVKIDSRLPLPFRVEISRRDGSPEILPIIIIPVYKAPAYAGSGVGKMYAALPPLLERLFPRLGHGAKCPQELSPTMHAINEDHSRLTHTKANCVAYVLKFTFCP